MYYSTSIWTARPSPVVRGARGPYNTSYFLDSIHKDNGNQFEIRKYRYLKLSTRGNGDSSKPESNNRMYYSATGMQINIYMYILKFLITITSWFDNLSLTQKSNKQSNVVQWIGSESNPPFQDASTCLLLELSRHYLHKLKKVARLACTHLLNKSGSAWKEHRLRMQPIFLSFWMSVKLVNSRRPSDSEFHLKLFLEIFRHVSMKRCIIVRRAIGNQVFIFNFWMSDNLQVKTMFW